MSADNYLLVRKHPFGGFGVVMGFASSDNVPVVDMYTQEHATLGEALAAAYNDVEEGGIEYGVQIHPEVNVHEDLMRPLTDVGGVQHEDHWDFPPYCPKAPTVEVVPDWPGNPLACRGDYHLMVGQGLGCACGAVEKKHGHA